MRRKKENFKSAKKNQQQIPESNIVWACPTSQNPLCFSSLTGLTLQKTFVVNHQFLLHKREAWQISVSCFPLKNSHHLPFLQNLYRYVCLSICLSVSFASVGRCRWACSPGEPILYVQRFPISRIFSTVLQKVANLEFVDHGENNTVDKTVAYDIEQT